MKYNVHEDITQAWTLPGDYYSDEQTYQQGKESYFAKSWQFIGDTGLAKVPGQVFPFEFMPGLIEEPMVLTRDTNDKLHLISNVCTHRGMVVCEGAGNERFLRCRYHGRRFGLDGKFQHMPEFENVCNFPSDSDHLKGFPLEKWGPLLFTSLGATLPFSEVFDPMLERLNWLPLNEFRHDPVNSRDYLVRSH
ncbi:MAG: aromatic ring-hydroxylating oxygenase subunit alpha, partial [Armatimonadota bacterium]